VALNVDEANHMHARERSGRSRAGAILTLPSGYSALMMIMETLNSTHAKQSTPQLGKIQRSRKFDINNMKHVVRTRAARIARAIDLVLTKAANLTGSGQ
jgi:3,4-dihydroxy-2-butanone 4-phosphate synthase